MALEHDHSAWRRLAQFPHRVQIPATIDLTKSIGIMHAWAIKRCGRNGYGQTTEPERVERGEMAEILVFHFPTSETAQEFAAAYEDAGAKLGSPARDPIQPDRVDR
jgi:hypothetical protein